MATIEFMREGAFTDLFLAINHYISTGDHVGEGIALPDPEDGLRVLVPYDPDNKTDNEDAVRLQRRVSEIMDARTMPLAMDHEGRSGKFAVLVILVGEKDARRLAQELVRTPGPGGWGSMKALIDQHFPDVRTKILSGEGV